MIDTKTFRAASPMLPDPGGEVVCQLCDEIDRLSQLEDDAVLALTAADLRVDACEDRIEKLELQLAGCAVAALDGSAEQVAKEGEPGWSPAYANVLALRRKYEELLADTMASPGSL